MMRVTPSQKQTEYPAEFHEHFVHCSTRQVDIVALEQDGRSPET